MPPEVGAAAALDAVEAGEYEVLVDDFAAGPRRAVGSAERALPGARDAGAMLDGHGVGGRVLATALAALHRRPRRVA